MSEVSTLPNEGPHFGPLTWRSLALERRHLDCRMPWWLVKKYCQAASIDLSRLSGRTIAIHSLRETATNDAIRNRATMHKVGSDNHRNRKSG